MEHFLTEDSLILVLEVGLSVVGATSIGAWCLNGLRSYGYFAADTLRSATDIANKLAMNDPKPRGVLHD